MCAFEEERGKEEVFVSFGMERELTEGEDGLGRGYIERFRI